MCVDRQPTRVLVEKRDTNGGTAALSPLGERLNRAEPIVRKTPHSGTLSHMHGVAAFEK